MIPADTYNQIVVRIIVEQENVIGPLAVEQAKKVDGLKVNWQEKQITISGDEKKIVENLISKYQKIFGQVSVDVCRHAVRSLVSQLPEDQQPALLK